MNWKLLFAFIVFMAIGFAVYHFVPQVKTFPNQALGLLNQITSLLQGFVDVLKANPLLSLGMTVTGTTLSGLAVKYFADRKQTQLTNQANSQIASANSEAYRFQTLYSQEHAKSTDLEAKFNLLRQDTSSSDYQSRLVSANQEITRLQGELNILQSRGNIEYVRLLEEALRCNGIPIPAPQTNTITVVK